MRIDGPDTPGLLLPVPVVLADGDWVLGPTPVVLGVLMAAPLALPLPLAVEPALGDWPLPCALKLADRTTLVTW